MAKPHYGVPLFLLVMLACAPASADQVSLKNGDRLTGVVVRSDAETLLLKTEYAGELTLQWVAVAGILSDQPVNLVLNSGEPLRGTLGVNGTIQQVQTPARGIVATPLEAIRAIRSDEEELKFQIEQERRLHPRLIDFWSSFINTGISLTRGNVSGVNLAVQMQAVRAAPRNKFTTSGESVFGRNSTGGVSTVTANSLQIGLRDEITVLDSLYVFGSSEYRRDSVQLLDSRYVFGAGGGYHVVRGEPMTLDLFGGASFKRDNFSTGERRRSAQLLAGNEFAYKLSERASFTQRLTVYPDLSFPGEYYITLDSSAVTRINGWLSWQVTFGDRYLSNPALGALNNDLVFTTGFRATFGE